jgi:hypothetical protein
MTNRRVGPFQDCIGPLHREIYRTYGYLESRESRMMRDSIVTRRIHFSNSIRMAVQRRR